MNNKHMSEIKVTDTCTDCGKMILSECFLHGAYCESCDIECPTCVQNDLAVPGEKISTKKPKVNKKKSK